MSLCGSSAEYSPPVDASASTCSTSCHVAPESRLAHTVILQRSQPSPSFEPKLCEKRSVLSVTRTVDPSHAEMLSRESARSSMRLEGADQVVPRSSLNESSLSQPTVRQFISRVPVRSKSLSVRGAGGIAGKKTWSASARQQGAIPGCTAGRTDDRTAATKQPRGAGCRKFPGLVASGWSRARDHFA